ncbi:MAG TPA: GNAT family N-acetyltransferase [Actinotalea sp.]|nr:GNAT family N-acetyltransferase [Actinotalea sp.]
MVRTSVLTVDWDDAAAAGLRREMYDDLAALYPVETALAESTGGFAALDARARLGVVATVLVLGPEGAPVGCASVRRLGPGGVPGRGPDLVALGLPGPAGELIKVFVRPAARRAGAGRALLDAAARAATEHGFGTLVLETGTSQPAAIRLYRAAGYGPIPPYPPFVGDPTSRCFALPLGAARLGGGSTAQPGHRSGTARP